MLCGVKGHHLIPQNLPELVLVRLGLPCPGARGPDTDSSRTWRGHRGLRTPRPRCHCSRITEDMRSCDLLKGLEESLAFSKLCRGLCVVRQWVRGRSQQAAACSALLLRPRFGVEHRLLEPWSGALSGAKSVFDPLPAVLRRMEAWPTFTGGYERCPWPGSARSGAAEGARPPFLVSCPPKATQPSCRDLT